MEILGIPNELLLLIGENLSIKDLYHFFLTCRWLSSLLTPHLHNLGVQDIGKLTALQWAAERGHAPLAELALSRGAEFEGVGEWWELRQSPLHSAAKFNHPNVIRILIKHGAKINSHNFLWETPLDVAVSRGAVEATRVLLELDEHKGSLTIPAQCAASRRSIDCMKAFVDVGFDLSIKEPGEKTILHSAIHSTVDMVAYLLRHKEVKVAISDQDSDGATPLHLAILRPEIVRLLLHHGADMGVKDKLGETPAHRAASEGDSGIGSLMAFRDAGFELNTRGLNGQTILHNALVIFTAAAVVEFLVEQMGAGVIINAQDSSGSTPLALTATRADGRITSLLVRYGADWEMKDNQGLSPAEILRQSRIAYQYSWDPDYTQNDVASFTRLSERGESTMAPLWRGATTPNPNCHNYCNFTSPLQGEEV